MEDLNINKRTSLHTLENETLLFIYKEATEVQTSEDFIRMLEDELERRRLIDKS